MVNVFGLLALLTLSISLGLLGAFGALSFTLYCMRWNRTPRTFPIEERAETSGEVIHGLAA